MPFELHFNGDTYVDSIQYQFDFQIPTRLEFDIIPDAQSGNNDVIARADVQEAVDFRFFIKPNFRITVKMGTNAGRYTFIVNYVAGIEYHVRIEWDGAGTAEVETNGLIFSGLTMSASGTTSSIALGGQFASGAVQGEYEGVLKNVQIFEFGSITNAWLINDNDTLIRDSISGDDGALTIGTGAWNFVAGPSPSVGVQRLPAMTQAGSALTVPPSAGSGTQTLGALSQMGQAASGQASGFQFLPSMTQAGQAIVVKASGDGDQILPSVFQDAVALVTTPTSTATGAQLLPALVQEGGAQSAFATGVGDSTLPALQQVGASFTGPPPPSEGTMNQTLPAFTQEGIASSAVPPEWKEPGCRPVDTGMRQLATAGSRCD